MSKIRIYRTYQFIDKDPVIDRIRTILQDEKLLDKLSTVSELSNVSRTTLGNWFDGDTKRPQFATLAAVAGAAGYEYGFKKARRINLAEELVDAEEWHRKQNGASKKKPAKKAKKGA